MVQLEKLLRGWQDLGRGIRPTANRTWKSQISYKWKDYDHADNSWEPYEHVTKAAIVEYLQANGKYDYAQLDTSMQKLRQALPNEPWGQSSLLTQMQRKREVSALQRHGSRKAAHGSRFDWNAEERVHGKMPRKTTRECLRLPLLGLHVHCRWAGRQRHKKKSWNGDDSVWTASLHLRV